MERARSDMLRLLGVDQRSALESGEGVYAVAEVSIRYRSPARLGDDLLVVTDLEEVRAASVLIHQRVMRGDQILTDAMVTAAFLTPEGRPRRQPRDWVERFERLQGE
jgi:acyl-CoA thioester hydrolase